MDNVEEYIKANDLQTRDACDVIEEFTDEIYRMRGRCIDIGCGPGTFSKNFLLPKLHPDSILIGEFLHICIIPLSLYFTIYIYLVNI